MVACGDPCGARTRYGGASSLNAGVCDAVGTPDGDIRSIRSNEVDSLQATAKHCLQLPPEDVYNAHFREVSS